MQILIDLTISESTCNSNPMWRACLLNYYYTYGTHRDHYISERPQSLQKDRIPNQSSGWRAVQLAWLAVKEKKDVRNKERMDPMELPDDMITEVLRRLPPRSLAACRRVCRSWRAVVDDRRLLREDLLPLSLAGIFLNLHDLYPTQFFSCPSATGPAVSGNVDYTRRRSTLPDCHMPSINITDHCNGLVLVNNCVTYPATRRWERLPRRHPRHVASTASARFAAVREHLVFDPAVSPRG